MIERICQSCGLTKATYRTAVINGRYYKRICTNCLSSTVDTISGGVQSYNRRRDYEDMAQDTIQPYNASGANPEFLRLYGEAKASKVFPPHIVEELKRKI